MNPTLKKLFLGFLLVGISVLFWLFIRSVLFQNPDQINEHFWSLRNIGIFSGLFVLYGTMLSLVMFLIGERVWAQSIVFLGIAPYFLVAPMEGWEFLGAFVVLWATVMLVREGVWKENTGRVEVSIDKAIAPNLAWVFTALAVAISMAFYVSPAVTQLQDIRIPRDVFQKLVSPVELAMQQSAQVSVQSFLGTPDPSRKASDGTAENPVPLDEAHAVTPTQEAALKRLFRPFAESAKPNSPLSEFTDALYNAFNSRVASIGTLSPGTMKILSFSLATALFTSIRLMAIPLGWIVIVLSMILFNVLTYTGFVKIGTVQVEKETVEL